jgi:hypothetical protein
MANGCKILQDIVIEEVFIVFELLADISAAYLTGSVHTK